MVPVFNHAYDAAARMGLGLPLKFIAGFTEKQATVHVLSHDESDRASPLITTGISSVDQLPELLEAATFVGDNVAKPLLRK